MRGLTGTEPVTGRRSRVLMTVAFGLMVSLSGVAVPAYADPGTISGAIQFPAGMDAPDLATNVEETSAIASFDRGDDEIHYEVVAVDEGNTQAITTALKWDVASSQLRWTLIGAGTGRFRFFVFWSRWVYTGPIPKQQDFRQFWLSQSSTSLMPSMAQATVYTGGTSTLQFHCAYGFEGCASGGVRKTPAIVAGTPTISGKARVGRTLTAKPGTWTPADVTIGYQWLRGGKTISGATGVAYKLKKADRGKRISVRLRASRSGYLPASATSAMTPKVKKKKR